jgi:hypothetical protein
MRAVCSHGSQRCSALQIGHPRDGVRLRAVRLVIAMGLLAACRFGFDAVPRDDGAREDVPVVLQLEPDAASDGPAGCPNIAERCNSTDDDCDMQVDEGVCDTNCVMRSGGGYSFQICPTPRSWNVARAECESRGYVLARIDNATQNQLVYDEARLSTSATDAIWIGGSDLATEGSWTWTDGTVFWTGGTTVTYARWGQGEPSNNSNVEHCAHLFITGQRASEWNDGRCYVLRQYACRTP